MWGYPHLILRSLYGQHPLIGPDSSEELMSISVMSYKPMLKMRKLSIMLFAWSMVGKWLVHSLELGFMLRIMFCCWQSKFVDWLETLNSDLVCE